MASIRIGIAKYATLCMKHEKYKIINATKYLFEAKNTTPNENIIINNDERNPMKLYNNVNPNIDRNISVLILFLTLYRNTPNIVKTHMNKAILNWI